MSSKGVLAFRWIVFLLAAFYTLRMVLFADYGHWGGPFRFLTHWALLMSFFSASRMLAYTQGRISRRWEGWAAATAVVNAMVVFLYWRLYFADHTSVTQNGQLGVWWQEYYLHLLGPALQWFDALVLHRAFSRLKRAALTLVVVIGAFVVWAEVFVGPNNATPSGSVTSGLPYPFLNNLAFPDRAVFYATNIVVALAFLLGFSGLTRLIFRTREQEAPQAQPGNRGRSEPPQARP